MSTRSLDRFWQAGSPGARGPTRSRSPTRRASGSRTPPLRARRSSWWFRDPMPRFKLVIEYSGGRYSGWQIQKNARTVQGEIDQAIREVTRRREFELYGAGRTDAGVHALAQVAHLELYTDVPPATLLARINDALPADIHIRQID